MKVFYILLFLTCVIACSFVNSPALDLPEFPLEEPQAEEYVANIIQNLYPNLDCSLFLLKTAKVQACSNFFSASIKITRGMLNTIENEAELACLLGHEIGHYVLKHGERHGKVGFGSVLSGALNVAGVHSQVGDEIINQGDKLYTSWHGRELEEQADRYGAELAAKAGYNPYAFCDLFERLSGEVDMDLFYRLKKINGTHPALDRRAKALAQYLQKKGYSLDKGEVKGREYRNAMSRVYKIRTGESGNNNRGDDDTDFMQEDIFNDENPCRFSGMSDNEKKVMAALLVEQTDWLDYGQNASEFEVILNIGNNRMLDKGEDWMSGSDILTKLAGIFYDNEIPYAGKTQTDKYGNVILMKPVLENNFNWITLCDYLDGKSGGERKSNKIRVSAAARTLQKFLKGQLKTVKFPKDYLYAGHNLKELKLSDGRTVSIRTSLSKEIITKRKEKGIIGVPDYMYLKKTLNGKYE